MTQKDFKLFASHVLELPEAQRYSQASFLAKVFAESNPRFKRDTFFKACGLCVECGPGCKAYQKGG